MIVLDTNVISELIRPQPNAPLLAWLAGVKTSDLFLTSITAAEMRFGVEIMPKGKRRDAIDYQTHRVIEHEYEGRVLSFTTQCAFIFAPLAARLIGSGINIGQNDMMIAAIALQHDATIATRNTKHFDHCGARTVNPFVARG